MKDMYTCKKWS